MSNNKTIPPYDPTDQKGNVHYYIAPSLFPGAGEGCFARHSFEEGEFLAEYLGVYHRECPDPMYVFTLKKTPGVYRHLDAKVVRINNPMRYVNGANHYKKSQLQRVNVKSAEEHGRIFYYAIRHIRAGEELVIDYGANYWSNKSHHGKGS